MMLFFKETKVKYKRQTFLNQNSEKF